MRRHFHSTILVVLAGCLVLLVSACSTIHPAPRPSATPIPSLTATITPVPTVTLTPTPPAPLVVLLAAPGSDPTLRSSVQTGLNDMITQAGLRWEVRQSLQPGDLPPELRLVVAIPPDPGLAELVTAAPSTQFVAYGIPGLQAAPNLTIIASDTTAPDQQGFIAGVIAAMLSADWRVGVISVSDTVEGRSARTGFLNGTIYFCGLCRPVHPPFYEYPMYFELASTASTAEWQEAANYMVDHMVETVYVYPKAGDEAMLSILAQAKINIIGGGEPPPSVASSWVVSLTSDPSLVLQNHVKSLLDKNASGGQTVGVPIQFTHVNLALFTPGKQKLAGQILADLQSGYIDTSVDLTTGENRP